MYAHTYCTRRFLAHPLSVDNLHSHGNGPQAPPLTSPRSESCRVHFDVNTMEILRPLPHDDPWVENSRVHLSNGMAKLSQTIAAAAA